MTPRTIAAAVAAAVAAAAIALAGCASHHPAAAGVKASARARVSALATDPAVLAAEKNAKAKLAKCADSVGIAHELLHPARAVTAILECALPGSTQATIHACVVKAVDRNGVGRGKLDADENDAITCAAEAAQG